MNVEQERARFEADAAAYGFDLTRYECAAPEPWSEYADPATGHRWAGWLAGAEQAANSKSTTVSAK